MTELNHANQEPEQTIGNIEAGYEAFWTTFKAPCDDWADSPRSPRRRAISLIGAHNERILDLGCGNGEAMRALSNRRLCLYGVDISTRALMDARRYGEVFKADMTRLPVRNHSFSCILLLDVFEHIVDKVLLLDEVCRILADSGTVIMTMPLPRATRGVGDPRQPYDRPLGFTETKKLISKSFEIEEHLGFNWIPLASTIEAYIPLRVGFALFKTFPILMGWADSAMLVLRKR